MDIYSFMSESPVLTFSLACVAVSVCGGVIKLAIVIINRPLRHMNIRKHGWPPAHCDADGDFKEKQED